jgi:hypothetical protein
MNALLKPNTTDLQSQPTIADFRAALAGALASGELKTAETPLWHYHTPDLYARRIVVPADCTFVTKVHKSEHISIALRGRITVINEEGKRVEITAPEVFVTKPGTHRAIYVHEECEWMTVHHCKEQDIEAIEKELVCQTMEEYNQLQLEAQ